MDPIKKAMLKSIDRMTSVAAPSNKASLQNLISPNNVSTSSHTKAPHRKPAKGPSLKQQQSQAKVAIAKNAAIANETWIKEQTNKHQKEKRVLSKLLKDTIQFLLKERRWVTSQELENAVGVDLQANVELLNALKNNPKVTYDSGNFHYKADFDIHNKMELLGVLEKNPDGIDRDRLKDSYDTVDDDVNELVAAKQCLVMRNADTQRDICFYIDPDYTMDISEEIRQLWHQVVMPRPAELTNELQKAHLRLMEQEKPPKALGKRGGADKEKKRKQRIKLTNMHLTDIDLSKDFVPPPKDGGKP